MIYSRRIPYKDIIKMLNHNEKLGIISCNTCARECGVGGIHKADEIIEQLISDGYTVTDEVVLQYVCSEPIYRKARLQLDADTLIILACSAGVKCVQRLYPTKKVLHVTEDIGLFITETDLDLIKIVVPFPDFEKDQADIGSIGHAIPHNKFERGTTT